MYTPEIHAELVEICRQAPHLPLPAPDFAAIADYAPVLQLGGRYNAGRVAQLLMAYELSLRLETQGELTLHTLQRWGGAGPIIRKMRGTPYVRPEPFFAYAELSRDIDCNGGEAPADRYAAASPAEDTADYVRRMTGVPTHFGMRIDAWPRFRMREHGESAEDYNAEKAALLAANRATYAAQLPGILDAAAELRAAVLAEYPGFFG